MREIIKRNPMAVAISVAMHIAVIAFMVVGVDWLETPTPPKSTVDIVQATIIDQSRVDAEVKKLKKAEDEKIAREKRRLAEIKRKQEKEKKRLAELEKKRKAKEKKAKTEAKKQAEAKKRVAAEQKRKAAAEKKRAEARKKTEAEKRRKAVAAKKKVEAEKKRKAAEAKKKAEAEKKRKAEEARRKAEAEKKRKAAEAAARLAAEQKALEDALQAELEAERMATERNQFIFAIKQKIESNWLRPTTVGEGLSCTLRVRLIPGGGVVSVTITRSSGSGAFDRSVEKAVYKADPLPVPKGAGFEAFRDLSLNFNPTK